MAYELILLFWIMVVGTGGELCVARAMKGLGEVTSFRPGDVVSVVSRALSIGWMWLGLGFMTLAFFALLAMLAIENVSFVVPVTALSYVVGALGGKLFLGEQVSGRRWAGVLLVSIGVGLVFLGKH